jgi:hypothetical protein
MGQTDGGVFMTWDMAELNLCVTNITTIILQLEKSDGDGLTIKNVSRADLELIKEALSFFHKVHFDMEAINRSVQASNDLILELVKDKKGIVEVVLDKLEQFKNSQHAEKENQNGLDPRIRRKI